jgi:hypothetical protein
MMPHVVRVKPGTNELMVDEMLFHNLGKAG